ncbi:MAG: DUF2254 domain-containing protein [Hyphomicrobium sp.]|jgi:uncharacterized membrane protein
MTWNRWYAVRSYVRSSLWVVPFIAMLLEQIALRIAIAIDSRLNWVPIWPLTEAGTTAAMQTIITLTLSFLVFTFGSMLVAIQVASGQLSPRIIATTLLRDNVIRGTVGLFVFTMLFAIGAVSRPDSTAPRLLIWISAGLGLSSLAAFLYLIDYSARLLRPVSIVWLVGEQGKAVIESVYPNPIKETDTGQLHAPQLEPAHRIVAHQGASAIILAVNMQMLVIEAQRMGAVVALVPRVGDFVATGDTLFKICGSCEQVNEGMLRDAVAFGRERTLEQDATFAFRVIVDIAIKALSKAINDPTTAVLAIDQLHRLLRMVGRRHLHDDRITDAGGRLRVVSPTPDWEDFVELSCSEIRLYGAENFQVARRLRAMILDLLGTLPEWRRPALRRELALLDQGIDRSYPLAEDRAMARIPDMQGLGGSSGARELGTVSHG